MLYALICTDKPESVELRQNSRPAHLEFLKGLGERLKAGGPFMGDDGNPTGSLIILEAEDLADAKMTAAQDPYAQAGLFATVEVRPWNWLLNNPHQESAGA